MGMREATNEKSPWVEELKSFGTQNRDRTGMPCGTGVWDQRVYQFRHLGMAFVIKTVAKVMYFFGMRKVFIQKLKITNKKGWLFATIILNI